MNDTTDPPAPSLRRRVYELLEAGHDEDGPGRFVDIFLIVLITLNVIAVIFESMEPVRVRWNSYFLYFEFISVGIFIIEYVMRVWSSVEHESIKYSHPVKGRLLFMLSPMAILDLLAIVPAFLIFWFADDIGVLRILRILRLLRVFRLTRYSSSVVLMYQVLKDEANNISAALFILMKLVIRAASLTYIVEASAGTPGFDSIPHALWWAIITMTTIGYGDVIPATAPGKFFGAIISLISVGTVALPAGLLASGFNQALHRRRKAFENMAENFIADGVIDAREHDKLHDARDELGLTDTEAADILRTVYQTHQDKSTFKCPHCGEDIFGRRQSDK